MWWNEDQIGDTAMSLTSTHASYKTLGKYPASLFLRFTVHKIGTTTVIS